MHWSCFRKGQKISKCEVRHGEWRIENCLREMENGRGLRRKVKETEKCQYSHNPILSRSHENS
jgi:hypothetical protein